MMMPHVIAKLRDQLIFETSVCNNVVDSTVYVKANA